MKITFITFHNWETKRIGGFHKLAAAAAAKGNIVNFFSFARPYYIVFKNEERLNGKVLKQLSKGCIFKIGDGEITNFSWPTLKLPNPLYRMFPRFVNRWLETHSFRPFSSVKEKYLEGTDVFVFESCDALDIFDKIRKNYPEAKIVYRPSDPLMVKGAPTSLVEKEIKVLKNSDMTYVVNKAGLDLYRSRILDFDSVVKYSLLPNGVSTELFKDQYPKPSELCMSNTALYVGARVIEWKLIIAAAKKLTHINFIIVCPETPPEYFLNSGLPNIFYRSGINPKEVPAWVTNCDVVIVPNPTGWYNVKPWGITAKYYQAMESHKPIVAYEDTDELSEYGVYVAHDYNTFINMVDKAMRVKGTIEYSFKAKNWDDISNEFLSSLASL